MNVMLLWDIDGTLVNTARSGIAALDLALSDMGLPSDASVVEIAGRTDRAIIRSLLELYDRPTSDTDIAAFCEAYLARLPETVAERRHDGRVFEGVNELIAAAQQRGWVQGLVTGNLRRGAQIKLTAYRLWEHFPFGAFADDSENRNDLPPVASRRAEQLGLPPCDKRRTWIIGDTPHDVACARAAGFRCLGVGTGHFTTEQLLMAGADHAVRNLLDTESLLALCENG